MPPSPKRTRLQRTSLWKTPKVGTAPRWLAICYLLAFLSAPHPRAPRAPSHLKASHQGRCGFQGLPMTPRVNFGLARLLLELGVLSRGLTRYFNKRWMTRAHPVPPVLAQRSPLLGVSIFCRGELYARRFPLTQPPVPQAYDSEAEVLKRKFPSQSSQAKLHRLKFQAKDPKRQIPSERSQRKDPK